MKACWWWWWVLVGLPAARAVNGSVSAACPALTWSEVVEKSTLVYKLTDACAALFECPAGSYCAAGAYVTEFGAADALDYFTDAWSVDTSRCAVVEGFDEGTYSYACDCGFGMWCGSNTALPRFCPADFYCRTPATINECRAGHYCKEGSTFGRRCNFLQTCSKKSRRPDDSSGSIVVFVVLTVLAFFSFKIYESHKAKERDKANTEMEDYLDHVRASARPRRDDKRAKTPREGATEALNTTEEESFFIEFKDLRLTLPNGVTIMRGPSGSFRPGRTTAIMGASGAGKTTIMNLISGKVKKTSGTILVNGTEAESLAAWKSRVAFVPQEDIMHRSLTVLDNVTFSAYMRLPRTWSETRKRDMIVRTLIALNLDEIEHSTIGDEYERGISGGQRKRVNVAMELVADPKVLFMDEPTSGLDSVSATELVQTVRSTAEKNVLTVAAVIHSPGPAAFFAFHDFILLQTGGRPAYVGPMASVEAYFREIGFTQPPERREIQPLADYIMAVVAGEGKPDRQSATIALDDDDDDGWDPVTGFHRLWHAKLGIAPPAKDDDAGDKDVALGQFGVLRLKRLAGDVIHQWCVSYPRTVFRHLCPSSSKDAKRPTPTGLETFGLCFKRACEQQYKTLKEFVLGTLLVFFIIGAFIAGLAPANLNVLGGYPLDVCDKQYPQLRGTCLDLQQNSYVSALQFSGFIIVAASAAVSASTFGAEQPIYWREASTNLNTPAYFFAKVCADAPVCFCSALAVTAGYLTGFVSPMLFGHLFAAFLELLIFGYLSGYFLSFVLPYSSVALAGVGWSVFWCLLFGGTTTVMSDNRETRWVWALSPGRWVNEGLFYASTIYPYEKVREGNYKGEDLFDMSRQKQEYLFFLTFDQALSWGALSLLILLLIDLVLITATKLDKKV
ncbi:hypothetical protein CTAYLR_002540 [Chrysophaeum taylorii]|uniref:ABC transporter domain-containing protein n=1 Tax=Chrysophaeum taylorii TaxID=2483200 RepID=A0AAD7UHF7_9STRA|nr:hypothetical protein CTAYLR_002540 [Chrysophaeum taylorii]